MQPEEHANSWQNLVTKRCAGSEAVRYRIGHEALSGFVSGPPAVAGTVAGAVGGTVRGAVGSSGTVSDVRTKTLL